MPSDKQNAEFMYAMLTQLDLKYVDWARVAAANGITNGHAARMRFSRYRAAMERGAAGAGGGGSGGGGGKARCKGAAGVGKRGKKGGSEGEDDEEGVKKRERSLEGGGEERVRRRVKVEEGGGEVKAEGGVDEDDVPIRLRVKREGGAEVKGEDGKGSVCFDGIPMVKVEGDD